MAVHSEGHASRSRLFEAFSIARQRYHAVCAAVSILESTLVVSLERLGFSGLEPQKKRGVFDLKLADGPRSEAIEATLESFMTGLKLLATDHPDQIELTIQPETISHV